MIKLFIGLVIASALAGNNNILPSGNLIFQSNPHPDFIIMGESGPMVTIKDDGTTVFGKDYTPNEAAKIFWQAMGQKRNCQ